MLTSWLVATAYSDDVLDVLSEPFLLRGTPDYIRSDNGSEFTAHTLRKCLGELEVRTAYIEPGIPWENGFNERFTASLLSQCHKVQTGHIIGGWTPEALPKPLTVHSPSLKPA